MSLNLHNVRKNRAIGTIVLLIVSPLWPGAAPALGQVSFIGLGILPGSVFDSRSLAVWADGSIVVRWRRTSVLFNAFVWTAAEGMVSLGDLPGG